MCPQFSFNSYQLMTNCFISILTYFPLLLSDYSEVNKHHIILSVYIVV